MFSATFTYTETRPIVFDGMNESDVQQNGGHRQPQAAQNSRLRAEWTWRLS